MRAVHRLIGYDRQTEFERFEVSIPERLFREVSAVVTFDDDDPEAIGCYELTDGEARKIANMLPGKVLLPTGLDFFLEADSG